VAGEDRRDRTSAASLRGVQQERRKAGHGHDLPPRGGVDEDQDVTERTPPVSVAA